jgi:streptogramin lyase
MDEIIRDVEKEMNLAMGQVRRRPWAVFLAAAGLMVSTVAAVPADAASVGRTFTLDADFAEGSLVGVNHDAPNHHQLQLNETSTTFPFIWVANSGENTISKLDTVTGSELGRYKTGPDGTGRDPSRTTVDLDGNVWVGNRAGNTLTKVGLAEAGNCIDRNTNGVIDTSTGGSDVRPWTVGGGFQDECILLYVTLPGPSGNVRTVAVDQDNNVYAGLNSGGHFFEINGTTGAIMLTRHNPANRAYGGVVDPEGNLWMANQEVPTVTKYNPTTDTIQQFPVPGGFSYGLGLDRFGHIWVSHWTSGTVSKIRRSDGVIVGTYPVPGGNASRGVAVEQNGDVWVANSGTHTVGHLGNDGSNKGAVPVGNQPTGVAIDAAGKVWVTNLGSHNTTRVNPADHTTQTFAVGFAPYNYSDMTGFVVRNLTTTQGTWTVTHDSTAAGTPWGALSWNGSTPAGTSISARVRAAETEAGLGGETYTPVSNGAVLAGITGRYIQIEMKLETSENGVTPVLTDVSIQPADCDPGLTFDGVDATGTYEVAATGTLPIRFYYGTCTNFMHDESVIIMIVDPAMPYYPITAWVFGSDIVIDDVTERYSQEFVPAWYGVGAGRNLEIQVYVDYALIGTAPLRVIP